MSDDDAEIIAGYLDGLDPNSPEPSSNRSARYRTAFANGRDDLRHKPRATADEIRREIAQAIEEDRCRSIE